MVTDLLPEPVGVEAPNGSSPLVFVSDHAGSAVPRGLGDLGLDEAERARHIGWDIGVYGVTTALASALDAVYVFQLFAARDRLQPSPRQLGLDPRRQRRDPDSCKRAPLDRGAPRPGGRHPAPSSS
jgi:predicted N-formylglutamate amidohydrolase